MGSPNWHLPLALAAAAFALLMLWRARPVMRRRDASDATRASLREAQGRIEAAATDAARALALCDAGDVCAASVGRAGSAAAYYQRAFRTDPGSLAVLERALLAFARRPRALEGLLWRRLAQGPWSEHPAVVARAVEELAKLYAGPLRSSVRGKALEGARALLPGAGAQNTRPADA